MEIKELARLAYTDEVRQFRQFGAFVSFPEGAGGIMLQVLGASPSIVAVRDQVERLLRSTTGPARRLPPILILGETGTGKGLLAASVHRASARAAGPFIDINCAAIPETLLEAEFFGFERGAFTDARHAKPGLFEAANAGTLFLDEIGLLPLGLQSKLLKVIEERSVRRLGSTRSEPLDMCLIAATSADLTTAVEEGRFRADLFHRLAVVTLVLPPLRTRGRDVLLLAEHFLQRICEDYGLQPRALTKDAEAALLSYPWPGNVRELANVLERAALLADEPTLSAAELALPAAPARATPPAAAEPVPELDVAVEEERRQLLEVLQATEWNFSHAAARLGVPRNTLRYRARRLGLTPQSSPAARRGGRPPRVPLVAPSHEGAETEAAWEPRRVTLFQARLVFEGADPSVTESSRAIEAMAEKVRSFGGWLEQAAPGNVLALFGVEPDEDAPRRAAHAAVVVQKLAARARSERARRPGVKIALHMAALLVASSRDGSRVKAGACEEARRTLEMLLQTAEPGTVLCSIAAARFLARRFDLVPHEPVSGTAATVYRLLRQSEPGRTPFVGRDRELRLLAERFELAQGRQGQVVLIVGEAGVGKSRLLYEFRQQLGATATWVEGQALAFGRTMAFHPVIDMLRRVFRIDDGDSEAEVVEKIERGVAHLGDDLGHALPFLRYLLSVDPGDPAVATMDPRLRHAAILKATYLLLERGAERRPHVLVLEDAHWADAATEEWIARLADGVAVKRALIVLTYRPGYRPPLDDRSFHTRLALPTLSTADSLRIAGGLLASEQLPPELAALVVAKAGGNPLFVEELLRSLQELGVVAGEKGRITLGPGLGQVPIPDTIEEVILARVRRLDPSLRDLLGMASVIGMNVPFLLLSAISGRSEETLGHDLRSLQAAEFLYETRVFPEIEHSFKHVLTQEVAYGSLKPERRRALHAGVVEAIEHLYPDRLGEHVESLARHAHRAELWPSAVRYCREAGKKAFDRSANHEAVGSWEQALVALAHLGTGKEYLEAAIDIRLALRSALLQLGEIHRLDECLREAETLATAIGDRGRLAWVWMYRTIGDLFAGDPGQALALGERAFTVAEEVGDLGLRATARTPYGHAYHERGEYRRAIELFSEAIRLLAGDLVRERLGQGMPPALYARSMAATCFAELGEFSEAVRLASESTNLAQTLDLPFGLVLARIALGYSHLVQGDLEQASDVLESALKVIRARTIPTWYPWTEAARGYALALSGHARQAVPLLEHALKRAGEMPFLVGQSQWLAWLAHSHLLAGRSDEAGRLGHEALRLARRRGERGYEAWVLRILGEIASIRDLGVPGGPEGFYFDALRLATELGMRPLAAHCHLGLGKLYHRTGAREEAKEHLTIATAMYREMDMGFWLAEAELREA
jgi:DNA-binding NtrC family response regulator/tetratricopeptide (TPR) repeat protein